MSIFSDDAMDLSFSSLESLDINDAVSRICFSSEMAYKLNDAAGGISIRKQDHKYTNTNLESSPLPLSAHVQWQRNISAKVRGSFYGSDLFGAAS